MSDIYDAGRVSAIEHQRALLARTAFYDAVRATLERYGLLLCRSPPGRPNRGPTRAWRISTEGYACPSPACAYYGITDCTIHALVGDGHHGKGAPIQNFRCQACGTKVTERYGTPLYRLRTPACRIGEVLSALAEGLDVAAAVRVFGHGEATVTRWRDRAGQQASRLHQRLFRHLRLPHVQVDEIRTRLRQRTQVLWLWLAVDPLTKLVPALHLGPRCQERERPFGGARRIFFYSELSEMDRRELVDREPRHSLEVPCVPGDQGEIGLEGSCRDQLVQSVCRWTMSCKRLVAQKKIPRAASPTAGGSGRTGTMTSAHTSSRTEPDASRREGVTVKPRITVITIGVDNLERSLRFYRDGLGLQTDGIVGREFEYGAVAFFNLQPSLRLALWPRASISHDTGIPIGPPSSTEFTLGHNAPSREEVDAVMQRARQAGAVIVRDAHDTFWGGYSGYFQDPDGHLWEVVWNPALEGEE